jgi:anti-sigma B factor antagonist
MIVNMKIHELLADITAMTFTGRLIRGHQWDGIEFVIRERIAQGLRKLVLDFSGLNYIDSAGIGFVAVCIGSVEQPGGKVAVACAEGQVRQLLVMTHLDRVVAIYPDLPSAQNALSGPATPPA